METLNTEDSEYSPLTADEASDVTAESETPVRRRGGKRPGSGRPRKRLRSAINPATPKTTLEASIEVSEKDCADRRFTVIIFSNPPGTKHERKLVQAGKTHVVEPSPAWLAMQGYESFSLNNIRYKLGDFVYVTNVATANSWVARILEVRAESNKNVYARVIWMYSPNDLPKGTKDGAKKIEGRQPYHGTYEYIDTNHVDVIDVVSISGPALVKHWNETDDGEIQEKLYWRQHYDCRKRQLSALNPICECRAPENPDETLIGCTNSKCGEWLHSSCLRKEFLARTFETPPCNAETPTEKEWTGGKGIPAEKNIPKRISNTITLDTDNGSPKWKVKMGGELIRTEDVKCLRCGSTISNEMDH